MAKEALQKIKEAEEKSSLAISNAKKQAEEILLKAKEEEEKILNTAKKESQFLKDGIIKKEILDAKQAYEPTLLGGEAKIAALENLEDAKIKSAVNLIVERIVNISGNS